MPNRVTKAPTLWPGKYSAMLAKALEDEARAEKSAHHEDAIECQSEFSGSTQTECEGARPGKEHQFGSRHGSKPLRKPDRETELVESSPCRLYHSTNLANNRPTGQVKPGPFKSLSKREEQMERCRKSESKVTKRLIKKGLAKDIGILKSEVEDLKQMVIAQQPSLSERGKRKRVSFQDDAS
ncbi:hypothetical protein CBS147333_10288 [Penicillium roqueforti]|uniref:Uncharacterized protein n=1 Tax=Penicillium concentricum TaxID=293559 RepID=A0A9W9VKJ7_9EURO|nr:uncharacterized protein N7517_002130 [Penicillium concentricum]KAF4772590.1 hypothetical protein HAV15_012174 [Penicillium sp. str. \